MEHDPVNHPAHYCSHPSGVECIEITRHMSFNLGNVIKYLWRSGLKDSSPSIEDLKKARWYLDDEIRRVQGDLVPRETLDTIKEKLAKSGRPVVEVAEERPKWGVLFADEQAPVNLDALADRIDEVVNEFPTEPLDPHA